MSEQQVIERALSQLQPVGYRCEFKDGVWDVFEVSDAMGTSSRTTNADGKIFVQMTNTTRLVVRVRDADGKAELVKTP